MDETGLTETESLKLITAMINHARNRFTEDGALYILWGWVVLFCCLAHFAGLYFFNLPESYLVWIITWILAIGQMFVINKRDRQQRFSSYPDGLRSGIWMAFTICTVLITFILIKAGAFYLINPAIMVLYGLPTLLTGILLKFKPLKIGAFACWILAIISVLIPFEFQLLMIGLTIIIAWLVPGYMLKTRYSKDFPVRKLSVV